MRARAVLIAAGALLAAATLVAGSAWAQDGLSRARRPVTRPSVRPHPNLLAVAGGIVAATNEFRAAHGRDALKVDTNLVRAARYFADYMAKTGRYGHTADGKTPAERVKQHGYDYCGVAENIADAYSSTDFSQQALIEEFVQGWIHSPPHRKNLLDAALTDIGVAVARSAETGYYYAVQDFGRPRSAVVTFTIVNRSGRRLKYVLDGHSYSLAPRVVRTHEECRPPKLTFSLPGRRARSKRKSFLPAAGDRFVVDEGGNVAVEKRR